MTMSSGCSAVICHAYVSSESVLLKAKRPMRAPYIARNGNATLIDRWGVRIDRVQARMGRAEPSPSIPVVEIVVILSTPLGPSSDPKLGFAPLCHPRCRVVLHRRWWKNGLPRLLRPVAKLHVRSSSMISFSGFSDAMPIRPGLFGEQYFANFPAPSNNSGITTSKSNV
jgi:hypothetical protein